MRKMETSDANHISSYTSKLYVYKEIWSKDSHKYSYSKFWEK